METIFLILAMTWVPVSSQSTNMVGNPGFEHSLDSPEHTWENVGVQDCTVRREGKCSLRVTDRKSHTIGATHYVQGLKPGRGYALTAYVRLEEDKEGKIWQSVKATLTFTFTDDPDPPEYVLMAATDNETVPEEERTRCIRSGKGQKRVAKLKPDRSTKKSYVISYRGFFISHEGWVLLAGDLNAPMREFEDVVKFQINGPDAGLDFLLDNVTLVEMADNEQWLDDSVKMIHTHRTNQLTLKFTVPEKVNPADIDVEVRLKDHLFAFGAKIQPDCLRTDKAARYNDFFYNTFNWATVGSYKWRMGQQEPGPPDFRDAVKSTDLLRARGKKVRAHSILWGVFRNIPEWVTETPVSDLKRVVWEHVEYMINITRGKVEQWDVQNEWIHGHFYEESLQDPLVSMDVFKFVSTLDPKVRIYLNDFQAVTTGAQTQDLVDIVKRFRKYGAPIHGIGIQGHTKDYVKPDPTMIWHRLNKFLKLRRLQVMVTEFDVGHGDDVIRADWLEDAMRAFFAHPVLRGVVLWGFWNVRQRYENKYLVYGDRVKFAEGATRFSCLVNKELNTHLNVSLTQLDHNTLTLQGYQGEYEVIIRKKGVPVQMKTFLLKKNKTMKIAVRKRDVPIDLPERKKDLVPECISHRDQRTLGEARADDNSGPVMCHNRKRTSNQEHVTVTCEEGEVLVGCSAAYTSDLDPLERSNNNRRGERITLEDDEPICNAFGKNMGNNFKVTAIARCCVVPGMRCEYRQAGPSLLMPDAMAEASCLWGTALGCTSYSPVSQQRGVVYRGLRSVSCVAKNGPDRGHVSKSGVMTSAACCHKESMSCVTVTSAVGEVKGEVRCPETGQWMTSCVGSGPSYKAEITTGLVCIGGLCTLSQENSQLNDVCTVRGYFVSAIATCCIFD